MPFVMLCGLPSSGKTARCNKLAKYLKDTEKCNVHVVNDNMFGKDKNKIYSSSAEEKEHRGRLKSDVQRLVNKNDVVILDSLNYIKGFRYELYCVGKYAQTPQCVIYCEISKQRVAEFNNDRDEAEKYSAEIFDALLQRFEPPLSNNRWDSPLFSLSPEDPLPCEEIADALLRAKPPPPNRSTLPQPVSETNFLHELDKVTQTIVETVMNAQKFQTIGDAVTIAGATDKITLRKTYNMAELQRVRRQFVKYTQSHPFNNVDIIANMFVQFMNNTVQ